MPPPSASAARASASPGTSSAPGTRRGSRWAACAAAAASARARSGAGSPAQDGCAIAALSCAGAAASARASPSISRAAAGPGAGRLSTLAKGARVAAPPASARISPGSRASSLSWSGADSAAETPRQGLCGPPSAARAASSVTASRASAIRAASQAAAGRAKSGAFTSAARSATRLPTTSCSGRPLLPTGAAIAAAWALSRERSAPRRLTTASPSGFATFGRARVARSSSSTARFDCFSLCSSRQAAPSPTVPSRRFTTSSAASFSDTNSTLRPSSTAWAMMFMMVCDLPVPGGPWITICPPGPRPPGPPGACAARRTASAARAWLPSESITWSSVSTRISASTSASSGKGGALPSIPPPTNAATVGLSSRPGLAAGSRSRHIRNFAKLNRPSASPSESTPQPSRWPIAARTASAQPSGS